LQDTARAVGSWFRWEEELKLVGKRNGVDLLVLLLLLLMAPRPKKTLDNYHILLHDDTTVTQEDIRPLTEEPATFHDEPSTEREAFLLFLQGPILNHILEHTNDRMKRRNQARAVAAGRRPQVGRPRKDNNPHQWFSKAVEAAEFLVFFALFLAMGLVAQGHLRDYWTTPSADSVLGSMFFKPRMTKDRWLEIFR